MGILKNRIDFAGVISAERCNPNGDPLDGNRPRIDFEGHGIMSDVCIKRKIRNRLQDDGHPIFMQANDRVDDGFYSMKERVGNFAALQAELTNKKGADISKCIALACEKWIDVRSFGQIFPFKGDSATFNVRGPVSITHARSIDAVDIIDMQIIKSINIENKKNQVRDSSTIGVKYVVSKAAYVFYGSIYPQLAEKTGFSDEDAEAIREALISLFENDASAARPAGSMSISSVYWWRHKSKYGMYSPAVVHRSLHFSPSDQYPFYTMEYVPLPGLEPEIYTEYGIPSSVAAECEITG